MAGNCKLGPIGRCLAGMLNLCGNRSRSRRAQRHQFLLGGPRLNSSVASVVTNAHVCGMYRIVIDVMDNSDIHVRYGAVINEVAVVPVTAVVATSRIPVSIINAAVKTHIGSPISGVPPIVAGIIAPIWRSPEGPHPWCEHPGAWYPVIGRRLVTPITGRPVIVIARARWLAVFRQGRRRLGCIDRLLVGNSLGVIRLIVRRFIRWGRRRRIVLAIIGSLLCGVIRRILLGRRLLRCSLLRCSLLRCRLLRYRLLRRSRSRSILGRRKIPALRVGWRCWNGLGCLRGAIIRWRGRLVLRRRCLLSFIACCSKARDKYRRGDEIIPSHQIFAHFRPPN
jgi:hypothetical protein